jgi:phosphate/sulfate permease
MNFWDAVTSLSTGQLLLFACALLVAFGFEFINGFHDTANAVTTVIYTRTLLPARVAVAYSGLLNFLGVLLGGTAVAFTIVNLLPVDLLVGSAPGESLVSVLSLLIAGVIWNLGTWYFGIPVSSSHTLIGSILGVGMASSLMSGRGLSGVNWAKASDVGLALLVSPFVGFALSALLLLLMKAVIPNPKLYKPPEGEERPPGWVRGVLIATCGGVSFSHGSNDGQKGMGLLLLVLIGFLPFHYALDIFNPKGAKQVSEVVLAAEARLKEKGDPADEATRTNLRKLATDLGTGTSFADIPSQDRWSVRTRILMMSKLDCLQEGERKTLMSMVEYIPLWVKIVTAVALGFGTMVGYRRIVVTVAERIGKTHMTYAQGAAAEMITALTVAASSFYKLPVSTTHVLSSGIAGTMVANRSGIQRKTIEKIILAWILTLPCAMLLSGLFYAFGSQLFL